MTANQQVRQLLSDASCSPGVVNTVVAIVTQLEQERSNLLSFANGLVRTLDTVRKGRDLLMLLLAEKEAGNE